MPPKRTRASVGGPSSAVGSTLTPGKRPRGQKINEGLPPIGTAISSSYGSGMSMTPKDLGRFQGTGGRGLSNTLQGAMNRNNLYDQNEPIIFADAPKRVVSQVGIQEELEEEEQEEEEKEEVDQVPALGRGRGRGRGRPDRSGGHQDLGADRPEHINNTQAVPDPLENDLWAGIQTLGRGRGRGGRARGKLPSDVDRTFGQESEIHGNIGIQETPRVPQPQVNAVPQTPQTPQTPHTPQTPRSIEPRVQGQQISLSAQLRAFWEGVTDLIRDVAEQIFASIASGIRWIINGLGELVLLILEPIEWITERIATGLNYSWRFLQKSWKPILFFLLTAIAATWLRPDVSDNSMYNDTIETPENSWGIRSYGWDLKRNIGQFVPYFIAHPISSLSDPDVRDIKHRLTRLEYNVAHLQSLQRIDNKGIKMLESRLPDNMALRVDSNGKPQISSEFWNAIRSQPLWEDYIQRVEGIVDKKMALSLNKTVDHLVLESLKSYEVMTKHSVIDIIQERYQADIDNIRKQFLHIAHKQSEIGIQLEAVAALAQSDLMSQSTYGINWFSYRTGAVIDPTNTSPTYRHIDPRTSFVRRAWLRFIGKGFRSPNPPISALEGWAEHGECWCTPSNTSDPKNVPPALTVMLGQKIYPQHMIIEHPPQSALLDPGATPKDFEVYAFVPGKVANELATLLSAHTFPQQTEQPFGRHYIKISEFTYDPQAGNNIQAFPMQVNLKDLARYDADTSTQRIAIRMMDNWGGDSTNHTCLYRARMYGEALY